MPWCHFWLVFFHQTYPRMIGKRILAAACSAQGFILVMFLKVLSGFHSFVTFVISRIVSSEGYTCLKKGLRYCATVSASVWCSKYRGWMFTACYCLPLHPLHYILFRRSERISISTRKSSERAVLSVMKNINDLTFQTRKKKGCFVSEPFVLQHWLYLNIKLHFWGKKIHYAC